MHSWYDKNRRHYGPKPNTRRARGLPKRDKGRPQGPATKRPIASLQTVEVDKNVKAVPLPKTMKQMKRYAKIYNWYVQHYDKYPDKKLCMEMTAEKFDLSIRTIDKAIAVCKYILATESE